MKNCYNCKHYHKQYRHGSYATHCRLKIERGERTTYAEDEKRYDWNCDDWESLIGESNE